MDGQRLKILWVDDDLSLVMPYSNEASDYELDLSHYECWDEAEVALTDGFNHWDAIILDAKCKHHKDSNAKADKFLTEATVAITRICAQKGKLIPWYVLSAGGAEVGPIEDNIPDERKKWDGDWDVSKGRNYYLKTEDRETLYSRIKYHVARTSQTAQLRTVYYRDVFNALSHCQLDGETEVYLEDLLLPTRFNVPGLKEYDQMWKLRKCVEFIFRSLIIKWQLLPTLLFVDLKKEKINLTSACYLLSGRDTIIGDKSYRLTIPVDKIVARSMDAIIRATGSYLHTGKNAETDYQTEEHLKQVHNAPYMIMSYTMALCDIILWLHSFVQQYPDPATNATYFEEVISAPESVDVSAEEVSSDTESNE